MHSPSALTEHVSLNLAGFFLLDPVRARNIPIECTELRKSSCTWFGEVCLCCSLTALPGPAWVLLKYVLQRLFLSSVVYRGEQNVAQNIAKKDPGRARRNGLATAGTSVDGYKTRSADFKATGLRDHGQQQKKSFGSDEGAPCTSRDQC